MTPDAYVPPNERVLHLHILLREENLELREKSLERRA
jgi:hypothetical protein